MGFNFAKGPGSQFLSIAALQNRYLSKHELVTDLWNLGGSRPKQLAQTVRNFAKCQWIQGKPTCDDRCKCLKKTLPGKPYCKAHCAKAYKPVDIRKDVSFGIEPVLEETAMVTRNPIGTKSGPASGKLSGGFQGKGKASGTAHLQTSASASKPSLRGVTGPAGKPPSGKVQTGIAKGGTMEWPRNNPNRK